MKTKNTPKKSSKTIQSREPLITRKHLAIILPGILVIALAGWLIKSYSSAYVLYDGGTRKPGPFIFFSQHSSPWGSMYFKGSPNKITQSGCGLTSYSMIAATLLNNRNLTPGVYAAAIKKAGVTLTDQQRGVQVAAYGKKLWGLNYTVIDGGKLSKSQVQGRIKTALASGQMVMAEGGNGAPYNYFEGHIIVLRSISSAGVVSVANPWDYSLVRRTYSLSQITSYGNYYVAVGY